MIEHELLDILSNDSLYLYEELNEHLRADINDLLALKNLNIDDYIVSSAKRVNTTQYYYLTLVGIELSNNALKQLQYLIDKPNS